MLVDISALLDDQIKNIDLACDKKVFVSQCNAYIQLLAQWGKIMNLTAVRDPVEMVPRHIIDSLSILPYFKDSIHILDLGTGAGLPGIPLSLCMPLHHFTLIDKNFKKITFVQKVIQTLNLQNVKAYCVPVQDYTEKKFDVIVSRAVAQLSTLIELSRHLLAPNGKFFAMKGKLDPIELENIGSDYQIDQIEKLALDGVERHLVIISSKK